MTAQRQQNRTVRLIRTQNPEPECAKCRFRFISRYPTLRYVLKIQGNNDMKSSEFNVKLVWKGSREKWRMQIFGFKS